MSRLKRSGVNAEAGTRPYVTDDDYPTQMRKRTQKAVNDLSPQVQSELVRPYKQPSYQAHEYYQVPPPGIEPWQPPVFDPIPLPSFRVQTPIFSVASGSYSSAQTIQIVCLTAGATIYYTLDNTEPTVHKTKYVTPLILSADTTLKARAFKDGMDASVIATGVYDISSYFSIVSIEDDGKCHTDSDGVTPISWDKTLDSLVLGKYGGAGDLGHYLDWFRFSNVTVPQGGIITSAYIQFFVFSGNKSPDVTIYGNDIDNAVAPTSAAEYASLVKTTANVAWAISNPSNYVSYDSPEIKTIVQEIVNRASWDSGNAMQFLIESNLTNIVNQGITVVTFDGSSEGWMIGVAPTLFSPRLYITY